MSPSRRGRSHQLVRGGNGVARASQYINTCVCIYVSVCICVCLFVCEYVCMCVSLCAYTYECVSKISLKHALAPHVWYAVTPNNSHKLLCPFHKCNARGQGTNQDFFFPHM